MTTQSLLFKENHLLALARSGRTITHAIYPIGVTIFALFVPLISAILGVLPLSLFVYLAGGDLSGTNTSETMFALQILASFLPFYVLLWGWLYLFELRHLWTTGFERAGWAWKYVRGLLVGFGMFAVIVGLMLLLGMVEPESGGGQALLGPALLVVLAWVVQGAAEEVLARGFVLPIVGNRWGSAVAIAISSLLFMVLHVFNANLNPIGLVNLALFGVFAAIYALAEGGLWGICALHSVWNWAQANFFGLPVSGLELQSGLIFNLVETGPDWLTGGAFGPEGSVLTSAVLLVATALVVLLHRRSG